MGDKCNHDTYWRGIYGTCVACRAEKAEAEIERLRAEVAALKEALWPHKMAGYTSSTDARPSTAAAVRGGEHG